MFELSVGYLTIRPDLQDEAEAELARMVSSADLSEWMVPGS